MTDAQTLQGELPVGEASSRAVQLVARIWDRDHSVWQEDPVEVADRLGWLDCPQDFAGRTEELGDFASEVVEDGIEHVVLVGMGGSSLYPDVLARTHGSSPGFPELHVLDSTHPQAVSRVHASLPWDRTLLVASSKSGTTVETRSHLDYFWDVLTDLNGVEAGRYVTAVTDPESELAEFGHRRNFRAVWTNPPDIGGRFSALSFFGLVPAALMGVDLGGQLEAGREMRERCRSEREDNPGAFLGAVMASGAATGRDKLTLVLPEGLAAFGDWIEQLVAESTGKQGKGLLPVVGEPLRDPATYGDDRLFVVYGDPDGIDPLAEAGQPVLRLPRFAFEDLGREVFRWEFATAVCGALMGLNPFDQPDVAAAKEATGRVLDEGLPDLETVDAQELLDAVEDGDYVALLAYVDPGSDDVHRLQAAASRLRERSQVPVTVGLGPRYLHSTGQLHKGGPSNGVFAMIIDNPGLDADIPRRRFSFGELFRAQAAGDLEALTAAELRAGVVTLDDLASLTV